MIKLTAEQFYEKYGDVRVKFHSYYNYTFTFTGITHEGNSLICRCGGEPNSIYGFEIIANREEYTAFLEPDRATVYDYDYNDVIETFY